jgi:hypothetical protein
MVPLRMYLMYMMYIAGPPGAMPRIERAALDDRAGTLGAACLAWDAL